jgi:hypothetical protein
VRPLAFCSSFIIIFTAILFVIFYSLLECVELDSVKNIIVLHFSYPKTGTSCTTFTFHTVTSNYSDKSSFHYIPYLQRCLDVWSIQAFRKITQLYSVKLIHTQHSWWNHIAYCTIKLIRDGKLHCLLKVDTCVTFTRLTCYTIFNMLRKWKNVCCEFMNYNLVWMANCWNLRNELVLERKGARGIWYNVRCLSVLALMNQAGSQNLPICCVVLNFIKKTRGGSNLKVNNLLRLCK